MAAKPKHTIVGRLPKSADLELHVKITRLEGLQFVNILDYVPSTKTYGKGVIFEASLLPQVIEGLQKVLRQLSEEKP